LNGGGIFTDAGELFNADLVIYRLFWSFEFRSLLVLRCFYFHGKLIEVLVVDHGAIVQRVAFLIA